MTATLRIEEAQDWVLDYFQRKRDRSKACYPFDLLEVVPPDISGKYWLIKGIIARGETSAWIAPPGAMKSALMAQLAMCVGNFKDWNGLKHKHFAGVLYFALERQDLVRRRLWAHHARMDVDDESGCAVAVATGMVDLSGPEGVNRLVATIEEAESEVGGTIGLVIFDTFAKLIAAGGLDENKAADQGRIFANLQRVKDRLNKGKVGPPHFALVGHTGKDETRGARGSNAFYGDVDIMVEITSAGDVRTASITKANDLPEGPLFSFKSEIHQFGIDEDGDPITVNIVSAEPAEARIPGTRASKWTRGLKLVHDAMAEAILQAGVDHRIAGDGPVIKAVPVSTARAIHNQRYVSNGDGDRTEAERKAWARNFKQARELNLIAGELCSGKELIWLVS